MITSEMRECSCGRLMTVLQRIVPACFHHAGLQIVDTERVVWSQRWSRNRHFVEVALCAVLGLQILQRVSTDVYFTHVSLTLLSIFNVLSLKKTEKDIISNVI